MLFVREPWWGSGLATRLHALAVAEAAARGYEQLRLVTPCRPATVARVLRTRGWDTDGIETLEPMLGLELVTYTRSV